MNISEKDFDAITIEETVKEEVREEYEELRLSLNGLHHEVKVQFSLWRSFVRGVVSGVGIAIGSGVVFVIISALLYQIFGYLGFGPEIRGLLPVKKFPTVESVQ